MTPAPGELYTYRARVLRVIDADTFDVEVDAGFRIYARMPLRLAGVDAPELRTEEGKQAAAWVTGFLGELPCPVIVRTLKPTDSFGRYLAQVWAHDLELSRELLDRGLARPW